MQKQTAAAINRYNLMSQCGQMYLIACRLNQGKNQLLNNNFLCIGMRKRYVTTDLRTTSILFIIVHTLSYLFFTLLLLLLLYKRIYWPSADTICGRCTLQCATLTPTLIITLTFDFFNYKLTHHAVTPNDFLFLAARLVAYWPAPIHAVAHC